MMSLVSKEDRSHKIYINSAAPGTNSRVMNYSIVSSNSDMLLSENSIIDFSRISSTYGERISLPSPPSIAKGPVILQKGIYMINAKVLLSHSANVREGRITCYLKITDVSGGVRIVEGNDSTYYTVYTKYGTSSYFCHKTVSHVCYLNEFDVVEVYLSARDYYFFGDAFLSSILSNPMDIMIPSSQISTNSSCDRNFCLTLVLLSDGDRQTNTFSVRSQPLTFHSHPSTRLEFPINKQIGKTYYQHSQCDESRNSLVINETGMYMMNVLLTHLVERRNCAPIYGNFSVVIDGTDEYIGNVVVSLTSTPIPFRISSGIDEVIYPNNSSFSFSNTEQPSSNLFYSERHTIFFECKSIESTVKLMYGGFVWDPDPSDSDNFGIPDINPINAYTKYICTEDMFRISITKL